jgi:hypothetical protein
MKRQIEKTLAVLFIFLFLITGTSIVVSADQDNFNPNGTWGPNSIANYNAAYKQQHNAGAHAGQIDGKKDGTSDAQSGLNPNDGNSANYHKSTTAISAQALGTIDGWNDGIDSTYSKAYDTAYNKIVSLPPDSPNGPNAHSHHRLP